jgi:predicted aspartyl protease
MAALPMHSRAQSAVPLQLRHTGDIGALTLIDATLHGRPWRAMLDTGASSAVVSPALARELGLEVVDRVRVATLGGMQRADRVRLGELRIGDTIAAEGTALVLDLSSMLGPAAGGVDGLIGMPALRGAVCLFDFAQRRLQLGTEAALALKEMPRQPLRFESGLPVIELRLGGREPAPFLFDTGNAGALVVFEHHARRLLADAPPLPQTTVRELGGAVTAQYALIERIDGPGFTVRDVPTAFEAGARARRGGHFDRLAGSVGSALFRAARVGVDDSASSPSWRIDRDELPTLPGGFGFALDGNQPPQVSAVIDGGPAARAGLALGNRLLGVQGQPADRLWAHGVWQALDGIESAAFEWSRADAAPQRMTLQRERFFPRLR